MISDKLIAKFVSFLGGEGVRRDEPMAAHTTFKTGGPVELMLLPHTEEEVAGVLYDLRQEGIPFVVIGRGSNLLVSDEGLQGAVVKLADRFDSISIERNRIFAQSGAHLKLLCMEAIRAGLAGLEFAGGIPGCVGGAVCMNAGAYDGEIRDFFTSARVLTPEFEIIDIPASDMQFGYRHSVIFEKNHVVLGAAFTLPDGDPEASLSKMNGFNVRRREKQPLEYPSAGSTFKRPKGNFAGTLIEKCGLKGYMIGGAQVSEKHAGFIINAKDASSRDIYELILYVKHTVEERTGVIMEPEVRLLGKF